MEREIPVLFEQKSNCCGCSACYAICPANAIVMVADEEGFDYPQINSDKCIRCERCVKTCPIRRVISDS